MCKSFNSFSAGTVFIRQSLLSKEIENEVTENTECTEITRTFIMTVEA